MRSQDREVNIEQYPKATLEIARVIDVREDGEWAAGHAAGRISSGRELSATLSPSAGQECHAGLYCVVVPVGFGGRCLRQMGTATYFAGRGWRAIQASDFRRVGITVADHR